MLSNLITDAEAALNLRVSLGRPTEEQRDPHPTVNRPGSHVISAYECTDRQKMKLNMWLEDNAIYYGFKVIGCYTDEETIVQSL